MSNKSQFKFNHSRTLKTQIWGKKKNQAVKLLSPFVLQSFVVQFTEYTAGSL